MKRFPFLRIDTDDAATGAGGAPPAEGAPPSAPAGDTGADMAAITAQMEALKAERDQAVKLAEDARTLDKNLAIIQTQDREAFEFIKARLRGEPVRPPVRGQREPVPAGADRAEDGIDFDALDDNTRAIVGAILEQNRTLADQVSGLSAQVSTLNERNISSDFDAQIDSLRNDEAIGDAVVDELIPKALELIRENPGLAAIPNAATTIIKALDHDRVAGRTIERREREEQARQDKLLRARGLGKRSLGAEATPGGAPKKRKPIEVLQSAINAVLQGDDRR